MAVSWDIHPWSGANGISCHTQKEHLDLVSLHHLVALELVLNLFIAGLALLVLSTHSTTHFSGLSQLVSNQRKLLVVRVHRFVRGRFKASRKQK